MVKGLEGEKARATTRSFSVNIYSSQRLRVTFFFTLSSFRSFV
jgi:hypothetical protein